MTVRRVHSPAVSFGQSPTAKLGLWSEPLLLPPSDVRVLDRRKANRRNPRLDHLAHLPLPQPTVNGPNVSYTRKMVQSGDCVFAFLTLCPRQFDRDGR